MNINKLKSEKCNQIEELINQRNEFAKNEAQYHFLTERIRYYSGYLDALYDIEAMLIEVIGEWGNDTIYND